MHRSTSIFVAALMARFLACPRNYRQLMRLVARVTLALTSMLVGDKAVSGSFDSSSRRA